MPKDSAEPPQQTPAKHDPSQLDLHRKLGHDLIPLHRWDFVDNKGRARGKSPRDAAWPKADYSSFSAAAHMASGCNVGVRLTATDLVIDVDPRNFAPGDQPLRRLCAIVGLDVTFCPVVETGGGGRHIYLAKPADAQVRTQLDGYDGLEFKTRGAQLVAAGSVHPDTGRGYEWEFLCAQATAQAPPALLSMISHGARNAPPETAGGEHTASEAAAMLAALDPTRFRDYGRFLQLMMATHNATAGAARREFLDWAAQDPEYAAARHERENGEKWDALRMGGERPVVTAKTLHMLLREEGRGDAIPTTSVTDDFEPVDREQASSLAAIGGGVAFSSRNGRVENTMRNTMSALRSGDLGFAFDELAQRPVLTGEKMPWRVDVGRELNDDLIRVLRHWIMEAFNWEPSKENVTEAALTLAYEGRFNPVNDYLDKLSWDGIQRIDQLLPAYFGSRDGEYERAVGRKLLIAAVRRARKPGAKFDTMPILEGKQGTGKTSALRILGGQWHSDAELGSVNSKDAPITLQGTWIMELGELTAMSKSEVDHLKAFVSRTEDRFRPPFEKMAKTFHRRCVFVGTTNASAYLRDLTGNRRFLPVETGHIDLGAIARQRDYLWAEASAAEAAGENLELPKNLWPEAAERQSERTLEDPWTTKISEHLSRANAPTRISSTKLLEEVIGVPCGRQNQLETKRLRQAMDLLGWKYRRAIRIDGRMTTGYVSSRDVAPEPGALNLFTGDATP